MMWKKKIVLLTSIVALILLAFLLVSSNEAFANGPPPVQDPTQEEIDIFNQKLNRFKTHLGQLPQGGGVTDILNSLDNPLPPINIDCPPGTNAKSVTINVAKTKLVKWDKNLAPKNTVGAMICHCHCSPLDTNKHKDCSVQCYIMLDPSVSVPQESNPPLGPIADEGLLYHELLHAQLLIKAMKNDANWQKKICNCEFDITAMDPQHQTIPGLVNPFLDNIVGPETKVVTAIPDATPADNEGNFEVEVGPESLLEGKENAVLIPYVPSLGNVDVSSLEFKIENGKIVVTGKLIDNTKPGLILFHIDPPGVVIFVEVETGAVILPAGAIPTFTEWGLIIFGVVLLGFITYVFLRRRKAIAARV